MYLGQNSKVVFWNYSAQALTLVIGLIKVKLLTTFLTVKEYGVYAEFFVLLSMFTVILSLNLGHGFLRFGSGAEDYLVRSYFWTVVTFQSALVAVFFTILFFVSWFFHSSFILFNQSILFLLAISLLFGLFQIQLMNLLLVRGKYTQYAGFSAAIVVISFVGTLMGTILYKNALGVISFSILSNFISILSVSFIQRLNIKYIGISKDVCVKLLKFGLPLLIGGISYWALNSGNRLLISHYLGLEDLGKFSVLMTLPATILIIYTTLNTIFLSSLSKLYSNKLYSRVDYWLNKAYKIYALLSLALAASISIIGEEFILLLSSPVYLLPEINLAMFVAGIHSAMFGLYMIQLKLYDLAVKPVKSMFNSALVVVIALSLNVMLIPKFGIIGSLIGNILAIIGGLLIVRFNKFSFLKPEFDDMKVIALLIVSIIIASFMSHFIIEILAVKIFIALVVFVFIIAVGYFFKMFTVKDLFN
jgi:O-antigen/teichoic acid export membrane protein